MWEPSEMIMGGHPTDFSFDGTRLTKISRCFPHSHEAYVQISINHVTTTTKVLTRHNHSYREWLWESLPQIVLSFRRKHRALGAYNRQVCWL
jgi:hypothetical protein